MSARDKRYPVGWREFARGIREDRAGGRCECLGTCGLHRTTGGPRRCIERQGEPARFARGRVMLTVAHLCDCEPLCARAEHVIAACNRCHLRYDVELHVAHAAGRRDAKRGQARLPGMGEDRDVREAKRRLARRTGRVT